LTDTKPDTPPQDEEAARRQALKGLFFTASGIGVLFGGVFVDVLTDDAFRGTTVASMLYCIGTVLMCFGVTLSVKLNSPSTRRKWILDCALVSGVANALLAAFYLVVVLVGTEQTPWVVEALPHASALATASTVPLFVAVIISFMKRKR
jgi:hypothetical protein